MTLLRDATPHAGLLKERILIEQPEYREHEDGTTTILWMPFHATVACIFPILPKGGLELWQAERKVYPNRYRVWMRAQTQLSTQMRVIWRGEVLRFLTAPVLHTQRSWQYFLLQSTGERIDLAPGAPGEDAEND